MQVKVVVEVVLKHLLEAVELDFDRVVHVAFGCGGFAQGGELLFTHLVVLELVGIDKRLELVEDFVGDLKISGVGDFVAVLGDILGGEVKVPVVAHDVIDDALELAGFHLQVRLDAAALSHLTAVGSVEDAGRAVGRGLLVGAVGIAVAVIDLLNKAAAGDVVLGDGDLEHSVIGEAAGRLHQTLAKRACSDDHGTVQVLQCAGSDFAGTGRTAVDEYNQRNVGVNRIDSGLVDALARLVAAAHLHHLGSLGDKAAHNLDCALDDTTAIAAQVEHDVLDPGVLLQLDQGVAHLLGRLLVKGCQVNITDIVARHAVVGHRVDADGLAVE